jgi:perosamine synthetase
MLSILAEKDVSARRGIMAAHLEPAYADHLHGPLPATEYLTACSLILPLFHELTEEQQDLVAAIIQDAARGVAAPRLPLPAR